MTMSQRFGVVLLAMGVWVSTVNIPGSEEFSVVMWVVGGAILVLGALVLANAD